MGGGPSTAPAAGSGVTLQQSNLPNDITQGSQNAFRNSLSGSMSSTYGPGGLASNLPNVQQTGQFNPGQLNQQTSLGLQTNLPQAMASPTNFGPLYSSTLSPLVQSQLSTGIQNASDIANQQNKNIAERLGNSASNRALISALQADNTRAASMAAAPAQLAALNAQRDMDLTTRNALQSEYGLNLQGLAQNNQANLNAGNFRNSALMNEGMFGNEANQNIWNSLGQIFTTNLQGLAQNNQALSQNYANRVAGVTAQNDLLSNLGKGLITTAPQSQYNFTVDDLTKLEGNPGIVNSLPNVLGGLVQPQQFPNIFPGSQNQPQSGGLAQSGFGGATQLNPYQISQLQRRYADLSRSNGYRYNPQAEQQLQAIRDQFMGLVPYQA